MKETEHDEECVQLFVTTVAMDSGEPQGKYIEMANEAAEKGEALTCTVVPPDLDRRDRIYVDRDRIAEAQQLLDDCH